MGISHALPDLTVLPGHALFSVVVGRLSLGTPLDFESSGGYAKSKSVQLASSNSLLAHIGLIAGVLVVLTGFQQTVGVLSIIGLVSLLMIVYSIQTVGYQHRQNRHTQILENVDLSGVRL